MRPKNVSSFSIFRSSSIARGPGSSYGSVRAVCPFAAGGGVPSEGAAAVRGGATGGAGLDGTGEGTAGDVSDRAASRPVSTVTAGAGGAWTVSAVAVSARGARTVSAVPAGAGGAWTVSAVAVWGGGAWTGTVGGSSRTVGAAAPVTCPASGTAGWPSATTPESAVGSDRKSVV